MHYLLSKSNPDDEPPDNGASSEVPPGQRRQRRSGRAPISDEDEIMMQIDGVIQAVIMGVFSTAKSNVVLRALALKLDVVRRRPSDQTPKASLGALAALVQQDPSILEAMEPLLSEAQIDYLLRYGQDEG